MSSLIKNRQAAEKKFYEKLYFEERLLEISTRCVLEKFDSKVINKALEDMGN